jgi:hypothetical protein
MSNDMFLITPFWRRLINISLHFKSFLEKKFQPTRKLFKKEKSINGIIKCGEILVFQDPLI